MRISFLPVQLFYITLFQLLFPFSTVANSVAGCLLREVELRQFVQGKKNPPVLQYAFLVAVNRNRPFLPPPVDPQQPKLPPPALHEAGLQPRSRLCKSYLLGSILKPGGGDADGLLSKQQKYIEVYTFG